MKKLWEGRFTKNTNALLEKFNASITFDKRMYAEDIKGSIAHSKMLSKQEIISQDDQLKIEKGLNQIKLEIENGDCFSIKWLINNGVEKSFKLSKLIENKWVCQFLNWVTPTKKTFNGHNTSCFKTDLLAVNGFNEEMQYGGLDREVGERLFNLGIQAKQIRYSAVCIHLDHKRSYKSSESIEKNNTIRRYNRKHNVIKVNNGIYKL